jgi:hypothetical protein
MPCGQNRDGIRDLHEMTNTDWPFFPV